MAEVQLHQSLLSFDQVPELFETSITPDAILLKFGKNWKLRIAVLLCSLSWALGATSLMTSAFFALDSQHTNTSMITIVDEFDLRNDKAYLADWGTSAFMIGNMLGGSVLSHLSDRFGRKPVFICCTLLQFLTAMAASFASDMWIFTFFRACHGATYLGTSLIGWVLAYEHSSIDFRPYTTLFFGLSWVLGYCLVAPLAYFAPTWRSLIMLSVSPLLLYAVLGFLFVPETLHFLVSKNKMDRIDQFIRSIDKTLNLHIELQLLEKQHLKESSESDEVSFISEVWHHKKFIVYCLVQLYLWTCDNFIYFGLSLYSTQLAGNVYLNYILMGVVELPAYVFVPYSLDKFGRKMVVIASHLIAANCFLLLLVLPENHWFGLLCWFIGKFAISCSFMSLFVYASEVFPTNIRNISIGLCSVLSRIGGIMAPYVRLLATYSTSLPTLVFFTMSLIAGLVTFLLPETNKKPLPSRIQRSSP
ncbi:unnamed protein product [Auanema sp. JU1783]|nr:unnamed protein product [Auanema sp. JU1783]